MNISDILLNGYYKTNFPLQHISIDTTGEITLKTPSANSVLSFAIMSDKNNDSEINIFCNNLLIDSAKLYTQPLYVSLNIPSDSNLTIKFKISENDQAIISDLAIDETTESFINNINTYSINNPLCKNTKTNALVFSAKSSSLGYLQLFILTLKHHNNLENTSLVCFVQQDDAITKQFLIDNNIYVIEYNNTSNITKNTMPIDVARLCDSDYICLINTDMMILDNIEGPFDILKSLDDNSILLCEEQNLPTKTTLTNAFNNDIYPMDDNYIYIEQFIKTTLNTHITNNNIVYTPRKVLLQISNYIQTYSTYFRKWIESNQNYGDQAIFNIASSVCANNIVFLHPSYNVHTSQPYISQHQGIYKYKEETIKTLHLDIQKGNIDEYLGMGVKKYQWDILNSIEHTQMEKLFPDYFDKEVSYDCIKEFNNKKVICYTNKLDLIYKTMTYQNVDIITSSHFIDSIQSCSGKNSKIVTDWLSYINSQDFFEYDMIIINDAVSKYYLRTIVELIKTKNIKIPIYCKIHHSVRVNKILPNLQESNISIQHYITSTDKMYEYYFLKVASIE